MKFKIGKQYMLKTLDKIVLEKGRLAIVIQMHKYFGTKVTVKHIDVIDEDTTHLQCEGGWWYDVKWFSTKEVKNK